MPEVLGSGVSTKRERVVSLQNHSLARRAKVSGQQALKVKGEEFVDAIAAADDSIGPGAGADRVAARSLSL